MPLPELQPVQPAQSQPAQQPVQPQPVSQPTSVMQPTPQPVSQPVPGSDVTAPASISVDKPAENAMPRATAPRRRASMSLGSLLSEDRAVAAAAESVASVEEVDPNCEQKLVAIKSQFVEILSKGRMRYVPVFETMVVRGRTIQVTVPSKELFEEIMRDKLEWLKEIQKLAGVGCSIDMEVVINEAVRIARPITIEDRLRHMIAKNERIKEMIETLVLDAE